MHDLAFIALTVGALGTVTLGNLLYSYLNEVTLSVKAQLKLDGEEVFTEENNKWKEYGQAYLKLTEEEKQKIWFVFYKGTDQNEITKLIKDNCLDILKSWYTDSRYKQAKKWCVKPKNEQNASDIIKQDEPALRFKMAYEL